MELPSDHHPPPHSILPISAENEDLVPRDRRYDEDHEDDMNEAYRLTNQHHVIGDSDEEVERMNETAADDKASQQLAEERRELLAMDGRGHT